MLQQGELTQGPTSPPVPVAAAGSMGATKIYAVTGGVGRNLALADLPAALAESQTRVWVDLTNPGPAALAEVGAVLGLHPLVAENIGEPSQRAKIQQVDGHAQINSSIFYIDWRDPQLTMALTCGSSYVTNAGAAASKGFDVQSQLHWGGLTVSPSVAYTDAVYTQNVPVPGTATFLVRKGMALPAPQWQAALAARYDFRLLDRYPAFVRGDYEYQSDYVRTNPGQANYDPVTARGAQTHILNARAGLILAGYDMNLFVNNLTNSQDRLTVAHTFASALVTASTFRPREVGLQLIYRY